MKSKGYRVSAGGKKLLPPKRLTDALTALADTLEAEGFRAPTSRRPTARTSATG